ncbi:ABC transporter substrate-binding protein [Anaerocolumna sedimenticola]|nr:extracellular solute-binding protein [Anaerocolumna sedimenticola]
MKKLLSYLLVLVMVTALTACSSGKGAKETETAGNAGSTKDEKTADTDVTASGDNNTLTVWCWDPAFNIYAMQEAEKVYQKTKPDFKLNIIETPWDDVQTKLTTAASSGDLSTLPDIFLMQDNAFQKNYANFPEVFTDLTGKGIAFDSFAPAKVAYSVIDGKNYGVPFDNGTGINCLRTDVLEQAGYTIDDFKDITWDKYTELGKDILAKTKKPLLSVQAGSPDLITEMLQSCGQSLFKEDGSPNIVGNQALIEAINVYTTLVKEGILIEVNDWDQYIGTFTNGTVAGTINGCWILASIQTAADQSGKWALTSVPKLNDIPGATNYTNNGGSSWAISSNCKKTDLAVDFLSKTFAGSVELYETILPSSGALATYLPAGDSDVYATPSEFFGGQKIYTDITEFAGKVPSNNTGVYYYEARDAVGTAITNVVNGADLESELKNAEDTVKFQMGQ